MPDPVDFFVHVPKTAGMTMLGIVEAQYPPGTALILRGMSQEQRSASVENLKPEVRVVAAHLHYGHSQKFSRPCRAFTLLREPADRIISLYYHLIRDPSMARHEQVKSGKLDLIGCARNQPNLQARYIAGIEHNQPISDDELLERARHNLLSEFEAFGLCERFNESVILFSKHFGWNLGFFAKANVTSTRPKRDEIPQEQIDAICSINSVDVALYSLGVKEFERRIAAQPASFQSDVARLESRHHAAELVRKVRCVLGGFASRLGLKRPNIRRF
jgi:hypothetical protein